MLDAGQEAWPNGSERHLGKYSFMAMNGPSHFSGEALMLLNGNVKALLWHSTKQVRCPRAATLRVWDLGHTTADKFVV